MHSSGPFRPVAGVGSQVKPVRERWQCVANEECRGTPVPYAPIALCGRHMRQVYAFARDFIETRLDEALVEMNRTT